jgi:hypothetical protein
MFVRCVGVLGISLGVWCCRVRGMRCSFCLIRWFGWWFREALVVWICWVSVICSFALLGLDSHLGFHWDFGVVVCGVCFAFWLSVGGFVRLLWCGFGGSFDVRLVVSMRLLWCLFDG